MSKNQHEQIHMPCSEAESLYAISESAKIKKVSSDFWWKRLTTSHELPDFSQADMIQSAWYDCIPGAWFVILRLLLFVKLKTKLPHIGLLTRDR